MGKRRRAIYLSLRFGMLAVALGTVAFGMPRVAHTLHANDAAALAVCLVLFVALLRINVPTISHAYAGRRRVEPGRLPLEMPLVLAVLALYGPFAVAALNLLGYPLAASPDGRSRLMRGVLDGGSEAFLWLCLGLVQPLAVPRVPALSFASYGTYTAFFTIGVFAFLFAVWTPLRSLKESMLLLRLWRRLARDTRLMLYVVLAVSWGYVATLIRQRAGIALGLAAFAPLPFLAAALRSLHAHRLELHRLRLARGAVHAMLGAKDPLPQISSLLASLHTPSAEESLQIYGAMSSHERIAPLARMGPPLDEERADACRRAVLDLRHSERQSATQRPAIPARDVDRAGRIGGEDW